MKTTLFILLFFFIYSDLISQIVDTIPNVDTECNSYKSSRYSADSVQIKCINDTIYLSGLLTANCEGNPMLFRYFNEDTIRLVALDHAWYDCLCKYNFSTSFPDNGENEYNLEIGYSSYQNFDSGLIHYYYDSIVQRQVISIAKIIDFKNSFNIYPNPFFNNLNIEIKNKIEITEISLMNILFQKIKQAESINKNYYNLNANDLIPGLYFLKIYTKTDNYLFKVIKR